MDIGINGIIFTSVRIQDDPFNYSWRNMSDRLPSVISVVATFVLSIAVGLLLLAVQAVALNGVIDTGKASTSIGVGVVCQGISVLTAAAFAGWFSRLLIWRYDWNKTMAIIAAVIVGTLISACLAFLSTVVSIPLAGIR
jgi:hypothetical protein